MNVIYWTNPHSNAEYSLLRDNNSEFHFRFDCELYISQSTGICIFIPQTVFNRLDSDVKEPRVGDMIVVDEYSIASAPEYGDVAIGRYDIAAVSCPKVRGLKTRYLVTLTREYMPYKHVKPHEEIEQ